MTKPVRLQLSRKKGFDLQALSLATNGLSAVNVARPGKFGNPFPLPANTRAEAIIKYRDRVASSVETRWREIRDAIPQLRGKNLACWCKPGEPCHADVLLEIANGDLRA